MEKLLEVKALTKKYQEGSIENKVVDNVNLQVGKGEFVMIMGASGSGKRACCTCSLVSIISTAGRYSIPNPVKRRISAR